MATPMSVARRGPTPRYLMSPSEKPWFLYILECSDGQFYTGITPNVDKRIAEHQTGRGCDFTRRRLPVTLVYLEEHPSKSEARKREIKIKKWGQRKKRELILTDAGFPRPDARDSG